MVFPAILLLCGGAGRCPIVILLAAAKNLQTSSRPTAAARRHHSHRLPYHRRGGLFYPHRARCYCHNPRAPLVSESECPFLP